MLQPHAIYSFSLVGFLMCVFGNAARQRWGGGVIVPVPISERVAGTTSTANGHCYLAHNRSVLYPLSHLILLINREEGNIIASDR